MYKRQGYNPEGDYLYLVLDCDVTFKMLRLYQYFRGNASLYTKYNYGMDNYKPVDTLLVDDLLYTSWNTGNLTYIAWSADNISILNSSGDMLGVTSGSESNGHFYTTPDDTIGVIFDTDADGNRELYVAEFAQTASNTRLTTTAVNETLLSIYQDSDYTVYVYYKTENNSVYQDTFCPTDVSIELGEECVGSSSTTWSNEDKFPEITMIVESDSCCAVPFWDSFLGGESTEAQCKYSCTAGEENQIRTKYWVNGVQINNAVCNASYAGTTIGLEINSAEFVSGLVLDNRDWFANATPLSWKDQVLTVTCGVDGSENSTISLLYKLKNTYHEYRGFSTGIYDAYTNLNTPSSTFPVAQSPLWLKSEPRVFTAVNTETPSYRCFHTLSGTEMEAGKTAGGSLTCSSSSGSSGGENCVRGTEFQTIHSVSLQAGNHKQEYYCGGWGFPSNYTGYRVPSFYTSKNVEIYDYCDGEYSETNSTLHLTRPYTNEVTDNFSQGVRPYANVQYISANGTPVGDSTCTLVLRNATNGSTLVSHEMERTGSGGIYSLQVCEEYFGVGSGSCNIGLNVGKYNVTVTCNPSNSADCSNSSTSSTNFTVESSSCAGTKASCGDFSNCSACGTLSYTCEGTANTITVDKMCSEQQCVEPPSWLFTGAELPTGCEIYSIRPYVLGGKMAIVCGDWDNTVEVEILERDNPIDPSDLDVRCEVTYSSEYFKSNYELMNFNSETKRFEKTIADMQQNNLPQCGSANTYEIKCYSNDFIRPKVNYISFVVTNANSSCEGGTPQYTCVHERTGIDSDRPMYCGGSPDIPVLLEFPEECGCPTGYEANYSVVKGQATCILQGDAMGLFLAGVSIYLWTNPLILIIVFALFVLVTKPKEIIQTIRHVGGGNSSSSTGDDLQTVDKYVNEDDY